MSTSPPPNVPPSIETGLSTDNSSSEGLPNYIMEADVIQTIDSDDQGIGDDLSTYTTSLASSVSDYQYENGRRYHGYRRGSKLHWAPIDPNPQKILDVGTGTGAWAIDIADMYPSAYVIGTDLSPIQGSWVPPNLTYEIDDAESEWTYEQDSFDLIHTRYLTGAFADWPKFIERSFTANKPGGWLECQEIESRICSDDGTLLPDSALVKWSRLLREAAETYGRSVVAAAQLADWMEDAGYVNVTNRCFKLPTNAWPKNPKMKEVGMYQMMNFLDGLQALTMALFTRALGWTPAQVEAFLVDVRRDIKDKNVHSYNNFYVAYGQKPE
ncbi:S-adenosyl-L-methionine-dependent methyltransferase [Choiromyces venosus 120613-1]|uniref:S-adenosyl-L-methionine-dependent methyltransferase n=1 Tax=Choiromyces venosus 120613-1 TaxID=1336337 RepID=A0A3N4J589_9PEZI|nr:S-adenosyl-L-methionine-dependent methyltransferase [Choiromyces venosus 120613-1]